MFRIASALLLAAAATPVAAATTYAQELVDRAAAAHHDVLALALHVTPPNTPTSVVVASSAGHVGAETDAAALRVVATGRPLAAAIGNRCRIVLVLQDASRRRIGALDAQYARDAGSGCAAHLREATALRDALRRRISHVANLIEAYAFDPSIPTHTLAQHLVDQALDANPGILIVAIHVATPANPDYPIIASNIGRIGKKADADDMEVIRTARPKLEINQSGDRFESEGALRDRSGRVIGAVGVVFPYRPGDDRDALHRRADALRAHWAKRIPDAAALLAAYPAP